MRSNPFTILFKQNLIVVSPYETVLATKEIVKKLMLAHIGIAPCNIETFAMRHKYALYNPEAKQKILNMVDSWNKDDEYSYQRAEVAIKEILGDSIKDEDVIFMLRMFCITKPQFANFEVNFSELVRSISCFDSSYNSLKHKENEI